MIKKILTVITVIAAIASTGLGAYLLGTKLGDILGRRFIKPRITEINVWNGPIPEHPAA